MKMEIGNRFSNYFIPVIIIGLNHRLNPMCIQKERVFG
jgi:hypothetical protein